MRAALQTDISQDKENMEFVSNLTDESKESFDFTLEDEIPVVQQEVHLEKPMEQLDELDLPEVFVQGEAYTSEVDDQEVMESTPNVTRDELLTFTEPLGYERSFLLTAWRANLKDKQAMTSLNKLAEEKEFPEHDGKSIEMNIVSKKLNHCITLEHHH